MAYGNSQGVGNKLAIAMAGAGTEFVMGGGSGGMGFKGTGIGFYRHARAYVTRDYNITGKAANAAAGLFAEADGCHLRPVGGVVERETYDGDWEEVPGAGQPTRAGDVFRAGGGELFFRVSIRRS